MTSFTNAISYTSTRTEFVCVMVMNDKNLEQTNNIHCIFAQCALPAAREKGFSLLRSSAIRIENFPPPAVG